MRTLKLKKHEDLRIRQGHRWVFSNEVDTKSSPLSNFKVGEEVNVLDFREQPLGSATINPNTLICARIHDTCPNVALDFELIFKRILEAKAFRDNYFAEPYYRVVHGEGDFLPGLILDRYGEYVVLEINTQAMELRKDLILEAIEKIFKPRGIIITHDQATSGLENLAEDRKYLGDIPEEIEVFEHGAKFLVPFRSSQKTGWFYDQRANRLKAALLAKNRKVLDACCYLGGFGVLCAKYGASEVTFLDASAKACAYAKKNFLRNLENSQILNSYLVGEVFDHLAALESQGKRFDLISIDPPAFIKRRKDVASGISAYRKLNAKAIKLLDHEGILVTSSCSYHLTKESLLDCVKRACQKQQRSVQILDVGRQDLDHPEILGMPETSYLKSYILRITSN